MTCSNFSELGNFTKSCLISAAASSRANPAAPRASVIKTLNIIYCSFLSFLPVTPDLPFPGERHLLGIAVPMNFILPILCMRRRRFGRVADGNNAENPLLRRGPQNFTHGLGLGFIDAAPDSSQAEIGRRQ